MAGIIPKGLCTDDLDNILETSVVYIQSSVDHSPYNYGICLTIRTGNAGYTHAQLFISRNATGLFYRTRDVNGWQDTWNKLMPN